MTHTIEIGGRTYRYTRVIEVLFFICEYARLNSGVPPTTRIIAQELDLSQTRVQYLMGRLDDLGLISFMPDHGHAYRVNESIWEPPPYVDL